MKPTESRTVQALMQEGRPFILAQFVTGKLSVGERVDEKTGKKEPFAQITHGLQIDREVRSVKERLEGDRMKDALNVPRDTAGKPDRKAEALFIGFKMGEDVVLRVSNYAWDSSGKRMVLNIGGAVLPL